eukprot:TRINITY_DN11089_c0_g1_i1.p2 TRINITY_DN11089_c0_g1~~TRINITY_DN11089_c0_g1_i1.p2  ORF type:complete len:247 (-),score=-15.11 TRINITY_DN11089_c0_g1_i1:427-1167(-)
MYTEDTFFASFQAIKNKRAIQTRNKRKKSQVDVGQRQSSDRLTRKQSRYQKYSRLPGSFLFFIIQIKKRLNILFVYFGYQIRNKGYVQTLKKRKKSTLISNQRQSSRKTTSHIKIFICINRKLPSSYKYYYYLYQISITRQLLIQNKHIINIVFSNTKQNNPYKSCVQKKYKRLKEKRRKINLRCFRVVTIFQRFTSRKPPNTQILTTIFTQNYTAASYQEKGTFFASCLCHKRENLRCYKFTLFL